MKRVLHVLYSTNVGGVESWLMSLYKVIDTSQVQFDFLLYTKEEGYYDALIRERGGRIFYAGAGLGRYWSHYKVIKQLVQSTDYAAVHCHNVEGGMLPLYFAQAKGDTKLILQSHNDFEAKLERASGLLKFFIQFERTVLARLKPKAVAVSERSGDTLFGRGNYEIIPLGVDASRFDIARTPAVKESFRIDPSKQFVVGHVGRFTVEKNHQFFVDVAAELIAIDDNYKFVFVGEGSLRSDIEQKVQRLGLTESFMFLGLRDDVPCLMINLFDGFLFPSSSEGLGLAVVESQIAGLPTYCSENVPVEARYNDALCKAGSLNQSAQQWATECHAFYQSQNATPRLAYGAYPHGGYDIKSNIDKLFKLWGCE